MFHINWLIISCKLRGNVRITCGTYTDIFEGRILDAFNSKGEYFLPSRASGSTKLLISTSRAQNTTGARISMSVWTGCLHCNSQFFHVSNKNLSHFIPMLDKTPQLLRSLKYFLKCISFGIFVMYNKSL